MTDTNNTVLTRDDIERIAMAVYVKERFTKDDEVWHNRYWLTAFAHAVEADLRARIQPAASEAGAVPDGYALVPLRLNVEMNRVMEQEGWQWEDLLAAAGAISEQQYADVSTEGGGEPVAWVHQLVAEGDQLIREVIDRYPDHPFGEPGENFSAEYERPSQPLYAAPPSAPAAEPVPWANFPAYLIDHCEGDTISEESLQHALSRMLADPQYAAPAAERAEICQHEYNFDLEDGNGGAEFVCRKCGKLDHVPAATADAQADGRELKRWDQASDEVRRAMFVSALSRQPSAAASVGDAIDAARWRMLPAFFEEYQIDGLRLFRDVDAALAAAKPDQSLPWHIAVQYWTDAEKAKLAAAKPEGDSNGN